MICSVNSVCQLVGLNVFQNELSRAAIELVTLTRHFSLSRAPLESKAPGEVTPLHQEPEPSHGDCGASSTWSSGKE